MKKSISKICLLLVFVFIFLILANKINFLFSELRALEIRWQVDLPNETKLEQIQSSGPSFHGDGHRAMVITCGKKFVADTILDTKKYNVFQPSECLEVITNTYKSITDKRIRKLNLKHNLKSLLIKKGLNTLLIIYDIQINKYFVFEEII
ncbi:hypothetical protein [Anaerococcus sp. Marseille-P3625]|uniref:hypothetical protein n=1 Tax=Anaerococcus sp. Marseille-P3625 TaxID=1977277 RepID=UPI000C07FC87|nr:hypothetical protein [Anaerococcus sp. Marseille-P3625]